MPSKIHNYEIIDLEEKPIGKIRALQFPKALILEILKDNGKKGCFLVRNKVKYLILGELKSIRIYQLIEFDGYKIEKKGKSMQVFRKSEKEFLRGVMEVCRKGGVV